MKILIVDDEQFVIDGLTRLIRANLENAEIQAADNGQSALALLSDTHFTPELLITDVSMPLMNGIELSRHIRARYPECRIMIVSGYSDFQAARSAIEFGALSYMLKPIDHAEMIAYVRAVADEIKKERAELLQRSNDRLEHILVELHNHMILGSPFSRTARIAQEEGDYCIVRLVMMRSDHHQPDPTRLSPAVAAALADREAPSYLIYAANTQATILLCSVTSADDAWLESLSSTLEASAAFPFAVGIGSRAGRLESIHQSYRTAGMAVWRSCLAGGRITCFEDAHDGGEAAASRLDTVFSLRQEVRRMLDFYTLVPDEQHLLYCVNTYLAGMDRLDCPLSMRQLMCAELVSALLENNYVADMNLDAYFERYLCLDFYAACRSHEQLAEMMRQFVQLYRSVLEQINASGGNRLILSIRSAIHADLRNASLAQVADTLNMSPSYISMLFKEKTGINFKDYLFTTRMNHAKRLLRQGRPIAAIARQIGYEDAEHFSRRFKAHFGASPAAYRKSAEEG